MWMRDRKKEWTERGKAVLLLVCVVGTVAPSKAYTAVRADSRPGHGSITIVISAPSEQQG